MASPPGTEDTDLLFGRLIIEQGLAKPGQVQECLRLISQLASTGIKPLPRLGELLVRKGYLTPGDVERTMRLSGAPTKPPLTDTQEAELPNEAAHGERLGKYIKTKKLGAGGMGEVWKAWDTELRRWVALKFLKGSDAEEIARFRREAQTAAKLTHPNIGAVYEAKDEFIAMQFVDGKTLETFPRDDPKAVAEILRQAALAVHFAHEQGVIHRDLKPANIMVAGARKSPTTRRLPGVPRAPSVQVYVMDFGLAKSTNLDSKLSVSGAIMGTPSYMSPEQARGSAKLDARTDIYSLGATLYELLANRPPFRDANVYDLLKKVIEEDPKRLEGDLGTIAMKCLEKDPSRRYATAQDLADDLGRFLASEAILAHPRSTLYLFRKYVARRKALFAVGAAGLVAVIGVAAILIPKWIGASRARAKETAAREAKERELKREKEDSRAREESLKELGTLWAEVVLAKQGFYRVAGNPAKVRAKIEDALARVSGYVKQHPDHPQGYYIRARGRLYLDELDGAETDLRESIRIEPSFAPGEALLGRVLFEEYSRQLYGDPASFDDREQTSRPLLEEARRHLAKGWTDGAERRSIQRWGLLKTREDEVAELVARALTLAFVDNKGAEAVQWLKETHDADPSEEYANWIGILTTAPGEQIAWHTKALEIMPHFFKAYLDRGTGRWREGDLGGAIADFTKAIEIDPKHARAYYNRGSARENAGDLGGATADFTRAIEIDAHYAKAYAGRGVARQERGDLDGAISDHTRAIDIDPKLAAAYANRGLARGAKGDVDGAIADYSKAIEIDPNYAKAYTNRGGARQEKGDLDGAIADHAKAIEIDPNYAKAYVNRGAARQQKGDLDGAIADYTRAIEINPKLPETYANRGLARAKRGDLDGAIADFEKALDVAPRTWIHRKQVEDFLAQARAAGKK